jgi:hypothetical protein
MKLLYIVPDRFFHPDTKMLGSTKDIFGRIEFFYEKGIDFDIFSHAKNTVSLSDDLSFRDLTGYSHIVVEQTYRLKDFQYIKRRWPSAQLIVRAHQSEILHRKDYLKAIRHLKMTELYTRAAKSSLQVYKDRDRGAARYADSILSIEPKESERYWRSLGFRGRFLFAPYFLPAAYVPTPSFANRRQNQIVAIGSSHPGPLTAAMVLGFHKAVSALGNSTLRDWRFLVTGQLPKEVDINGQQSERVEHLGAIEDLFGLLSVSRAVAVTSALGRGFKTKILDAISCGAWVIVPSMLYRRLPEPIRPFCIVLEEQGEALARAVEELEGSVWPTQDPNTTLRSMAYHALESAMAQ